MLNILRSRRQRKLDAARLALIDELFERVNAADPCQIPDCRHFRAEIHDLSRAALER